MYNSNLITALEEEMNKQAIDIDSYKIRWIVRALDLIDGRIRIPEEYCLQNFSKRFYELHSIHNN